MTVEQILFSIVSADAGVGALIGSGNACRIYPDAMPEKVDMPAASYSIVTAVPDGGMDDAPIADNPRVQIEAYALDYDQARAIGDAIEKALQNRDAMIANGCGIRCLAWNGCDRDPDTKRYCDSKDYSFWTSR